MLVSSSSAYLEEEVQAEQGAAGDDGKPGRISTGDGFRHVCCILGKRETGEINVCPQSLTPATTHSHRTLSTSESSKWIYKYSYSMLNLTHHHCVYHLSSHFCSSFPTNPCNYIVFTSIFFWFSNVCFFSNSYLTSSHCHIISYRVVLHLVFHSNTHTHLFPSQIQN